MHRKPLGGLRKREAVWEERWEASLLTKFPSNSNQSFRRQKTLCNLPVSQQDFGNLLGGVSLGVHLPPPLPLARLCEQLYDCDSVVLYTQLPPFQHVLLLRCKTIKNTHGTMAWIGQPLLSTKIKQQGRNCATQ